MIQTIRWTILIQQPIDFRKSEKGFVFSVSILISESGGIDILLHYADELVRHDCDYIWDRLFGMREVERIKLAYSEIKVYKDKQLFFCCLNSIDFSMIISEKDIFNRWILLLLLFFFIALWVTLLFSQSFWMLVF